VGTVSLNQKGNIPAFIHISDGKLHDVNVLDLLIPEPGAFYIMDRGYVDFKRLFTLHRMGHFFVIRAKSKVLVPCGVRAGMEAGRTQAAEGNGRRPIVCTRNRTDPISSCAKNGDAPDEFYKQIF